MDPCRLKYLTGYDDLHEKHESLTTAGHASHSYVKQVALMLFICYLSGDSAFICPSKLLYHNMFDVMLLH